MALTGLDMGFDHSVITNSMFRVGFKSVRSRTLEMPMGQMDLDIGRKYAEKLLFPNPDTTSLFNTYVRHI